ncbi:unnamed protein product [Closterium sp. NIES-54]
MVHQVLQRLGFQLSSPQPTPMSTDHSLSAPPSDESVELSGPYRELVSCLMYLMTCTRPYLAYPLSLLARYVAPSRNQKVHWDAAKRVLRNFCSTSGMRLVLGGRGLVVLTGHANTSWIVMDAEMASRKSTGTYVDAVPRPRANIVDGMWIFKVKRPPGSLPAFKAHYVARGIIYGLRQAPRKWYDTLRTTLAALGFAPSTSDPSLFLRTDTSLTLFYVLVYVDNLVFATANTEALALVKSELQERHTCTDLGELHSYLGLQITRDTARCTITLTQSHVVHQVLRRFGFQFSSPLSTSLPTGHSLSAPPLDESVEPSGPCEAEIYAGAMAAQKLRWLTCLQNDLGERLRSSPIPYVDDKAMIALCQEHRLKH